MIKNIVFDIGNVVFDFKPTEYFKDVEGTHAVCEYIFSTQEWIDYDLGLKTIEEVQAIYVKQKPEYEEILDYVLSRWTQVLKPKITLSRIDELKDKGYQIYLLSNLSFDAAAYLDSEYQLFAKVDGYVLSCEEHVVKPDEAIYNILCDKYKLVKEECAFLDDMKANIEAANQIGMQAIHYQSDSQAHAELDKLLKEMGYVK